MRIVFYEIKKIWSIKILLIIAVLCALFYSMFMEFNIKYFPNGHSITEEVDYGIEMTQRYGSALEAGELSDFVTATRSELISEAESYIGSNPVFAAAQIYGYSDYAKMKEKEFDSVTQEESDANMLLFGEDCNYVGARLQALGSIEENYYNYPEYTLNRSISETASERELARLMEIYETEEYRNIMSGWVFENTVTYTIHLAILAVLAVLVLVSPLIVTDRARNVHLLQYTAKHGRRILKQQLIAVILSAFLLTTALLLVFGAIYSTNGTWPFWNNGLTSFLNADFFWFDITYGQYMIAYIVLLYSLCLGTAAIAFILSRFSQNLITLILKLIPAFAVLGALCFSVFYNTFSLENLLYMGTGLVGAEPILCSLALAAGLAASFFTLQREKKVDVA